MRNRKNLRLTITAVMMLMVASVAFSNGKQESSTKQGAEGPITLRYLSYEKNLEVQQSKIVAEFEKRNPGIKVNIDYISPGHVSQFVQKEDIMLQAGDKFDVGVNTIFLDVVKRGKAGMFYPLDGLFKKEGTSYDQEYNIDGLIDGNHYALPADVKSWIVYINKNDLDAAGLPVPPLNWTWADYREYAKKLTHGSGDNKHYGSFLMNVWQHFFNFYVYSSKMGTPYFDSNNHFDPTYPDLWSFLKLRYDMENIDKSQMPSSDVVSLNMFAPDAFFTGKASMTVYGTWFIADIKNTTDFPHDFVTTFAPLPRRDASSRDGRTYTENRWWWLPKNVSHPDAAFKFIRFYTTEGMLIKGAGFSASRRKPARDEIIKLMTNGNKSGLYDMKALKAVLDNPKWQNNTWNYNPPWLGELSHLQVSIANTYLTGGSTLKQAEEQFAKEGQKIIDRGTAK